MVTPPGMIHCIVLSVQQQQMTKVAASKESKSNFSKFWLVSVAKQAGLTFVANPSKVSAGMAARASC